MASARYEFVTLNSGVGETKLFANTIKEVHGVGRVTVTTTVTAAGSRPTAPAAFGDYPKGGHVRITAVGGPFVVVIGDNPTASETSPTGVRIEAGTTEYLPIKSLQKLSFITVE